MEHDTQTLLDRQVLPPRAPLVDPFARAITYLRVSVTDRCDFRCVYCMAENMTFLPKVDLLSLEELDRLCSVFIAKGVRKLRLTGGEPLVRRGIMTLVGSLARHLKTGALDELTLTTNGSQLPKYARELVDLGVKRVNVSLDTLDPDKFRAITRWGELDKVLAGIDAAQAAGLNITTSTCRSRSCARAWPSAIRSTRSTTAPAVLPATCASPRLADGSASSPPSPTISAKAAIACG